MTSKVVRRPLLLALVLGCGISVLVSGRFTARLIADGALSFAFVPIFELIAFALVYYLRRSPIPFVDAVDRFFAGNTPWLWWLIGIMIAVAMLPPTRHASLMAPILLTMLIPIALSVGFDLRFFREVIGSTRRGAILDVVILRLVAWTGVTAYFFISAITGRDFFYLFVEARDLVVSWAQEIS
jgi:hypothetical protein